MPIKKRVINILISPGKEWAIIKKEKSRVSDMFSKYTCILAAIPALSLFLGKSVIGFYGFNSIFRLSHFKGLLMAGLLYIGSLVGIFILGLIIDNLAPYFGSEKNSVSSYKVAVYGSTASLVGGIFHLIPLLSWIANLAGLYSLFLLFLGLKSLKHVPNSKMPLYFLVVIIVAALIYSVIGFIASSMAFGAYAFNSLIGL